MFLQQGYSSIGRASVSKTEGWGFDSLRPCHSSIKIANFMADKIKFALALVILAAGVAGFYLLSEQAMILRVLAVLAGLALAAVVAWKTEPGQRFFTFANESVAEAKKVVWPTRKETMQTTGVVFAFVRGHGAVPLADRQEPRVGALRPGAGLEEIMSKALVCRPCLFRLREERVSAPFMERIDRAGHAGQVRPDSGAGRRSGRDEEWPEERSPSASSSPAMCWSKWTWTTSPGIWSRTRPR